MKLTLKQKAFADYYIQLGNAAEAAVKAGYSKKTAREIGYENLTKPHIKGYIDETMAQKDHDRIMAQDEILERLTRIARAEGTEEVIVVYKTHFEKVEKKPSFKDQIKALEDLGKRYSLFTDNVNHYGDIGLHINVDYGDDDYEES